MPEEVEQWLVKMQDGKEFVVSLDGMAAVDEAMANDVRSVRFDRMLIATPYIVWVERLKETKVEETPELPKITDEQRQRNAKQIKEIRERLKGKMWAKEEQ